MRQAMYDEELLRQLDDEEASAVMPQQELLNCLSEAGDVVREHNDRSLAALSFLLEAGKVQVDRRGRRRNEVLGAETSPLFERVA